MSSALENLCGPGKPWTAVSILPMALRMRKALAVTQVQVAKSLGKRQDEISRIEQRGDLLLSTPRDYVQSLGGELELLCTFKNRGSVRIRTGKVSR